VETCRKDRVIARKGTAAVGTNPIVDGLEAKRGIANDLQAEAFDRVSCSHEVPGTRFTLTHCAAYDAIMATTDSPAIHRSRNRDEGEQEQGAGFRANNHGPENRDRTSQNVIQRRIEPGRKVPSWLEICHRPRSTTRACPAGPDDVLVLAERSHVWVRGTSGS